MDRLTVLVVGATGSIGRLIVEEAVRQGHAARALVRDPGRALELPPEAQVVKGDLTRPETLAAAVEGVDAVVFTAGVGENDAIVRGRALGGLDGLGIAIDARRNTAASREARFVSPDGARVAVLVVPTDEELEMAAQAAALVSTG